MAPASAPNDDSDLEDLIKKKTGDGKSRATAEIDSSYPPGAAAPGLTNPLTFVFGACRLCAYRCPRLAQCALALAILGVAAYFTNVVFNPTQATGVMGADYSAIRSAYELSLEKVDHWCIRGDNDSCKCESPLEPTPRAEFRSWNVAHKSNVADVAQYRAVFGASPTAVDANTGSPRPPIDVAFVGESVVEAMDGRWLGKRMSSVTKMGEGREGQEARKPEIDKLFEKFFRKESGAPVEGVALGIAGDTTSSVLWRLQHDEMPYDFNPQVWWLVLGMNDLARMQCSEEIVVLGILRVVEEIRLRKPDAKIVINSLLPMVDYQKMQAPKMADFADFKREKKNVVRESMEVKNAKDKFQKVKAAKDAANGAAAGGTRGLEARSDPRRHLKTEEKKKEGDRTGKKGGDREGKKGGPQKKLKRMEGGKEWNKKKRGEAKEDATEGAALVNALKRKEIMLDKQDKRVRNKVFKDEEKYHPKKAVAPFVPLVKKRVLPAVWPAVHLINAKLKEFAAKHDAVTFFDATPIFSTKEPKGGHLLKNELISPRGHPSAFGFAVWEGQIMGRLQQLLEDRPAPRLAPAEEDDRGDGEEDGGEDDDDEEDGEGSGRAGAPKDKGGEGAERVSAGKESVLKERPAPGPVPAKEDNSGDGKEDGGEDDKDEDDDDDGDDDDDEDDDDDDDDGDDDDDDDEEDDDDDDDEKDDGDDDKEDVVVAKLKSAGKGKPAGPGQPGGPPLPAARSGRAAAPKDNGKEGGEQVSAGKEAVPPPLAEQPRRSAPAGRVDAPKDASGEGADHVSAGKEYVPPPAAEQPSRSAPSGRGDAAGGKESPEGRGGAGATPAAGDRATATPAKGAIRDAIGVAAADTGLTGKPSATKKKENIGSAVKKDTKQKPITDPKAVTTTAGDKVLVTPSKSAPVSGGK